MGSAINCPAIECPDYGIGLRGRFNKLDSSASILAARTTKLKGTGVFASEINNKGYARRISKQPMSDCRGENGAALAIDDRQNRTINGKKKCSEFGPTWVENKTEYPIVKKRIGKR